MKQNDRIIGLIGGMGPHASAYFYDMLLKKSNALYGAKNNDDYPEILIDSVPVPDFISDTSKMEYARKMLISRIQRLNNYGCSVVAMVCNTGHILYPELSKHSKVEFISLINLVAKAAKDRKLKRVGILATQTTIKTGLYSKALSTLGIKPFHPTLDMQEYHEKVIRDVISGSNTGAHKIKLYEMTNRFIKNNNLDGIILGCTELPLVFPKDQFNNVVDCLEVLSNELLGRYYQKDVKYE